MKLSVSCFCSEELCHVRGTGKMLFFFISIYILSLKNFNNILALPKFLGMQVLGSQTAQKDI